MARVLPSWEVPFATESLPKEHLSLLTAVGTGMTDRIRFLEHFEEHAAEQREGTYLLGLAHLRCGMPFGALLILSDLAEERPEHIPLRVDVATALVHAGRAEAARALLEQARETLRQRGGGLSTRWLARIGERLAWLDRSAELRDLERKFLVLRAAAWDEVPHDTMPVETMLRYAQTLCALGELDDAAEPFWDAARVVTRAMKAGPVRVAILEMLVRITRSGLPVSLQRIALDALRRQAPGSPVLRAARALTLEERTLRRREARSEWHVIREDFEYGDDETRARALQRVQQRAMCGDHRSPFLAVWVSVNARSGRTEMARAMSAEVAEEPDMEPGDLLWIAESLASCGLRDEALDHARRCARHTDAPEEAALAEAFLEGLDGAAR
ncbi:tetratricopeptide repeat protein [Streptomyces sp. NPDC059002]|uniref:tetratricopeptide repeat protein n=1 Tax=Streptomyces sp. NPDC059002 TaxID=3346690 RepID=UPI0036CFFFD8